MCYACHVKLPVMRYAGLSSHSEVEDVPTLVLLSPEGQVFPMKGRVQRLTKLDQAPGGQGLRHGAARHPDNGGYYLWKRPEGAGEGVTEADVARFIADYNAKSLERRQLS